MSANTRPTLDDVSQAVAGLIETGTLRCEKTRNKGAVGLLCEKLTGIPTSSAHIDCVDGEVKVFPLKALKTGTLTPKETIAVTMLNTSHLRDQADFASSDCGTKLRRVLFVPYIRLDDETVRFFPPTLFELSAASQELLAADYAAIRTGFIESETLSSSTGKLLQNRTKGAGGDAPKTRAFYLRKEFITAHVKTTWA
jgi:hypothetical protein